MEGNGDVSRNVFSFEELQEAGSVGLNDCPECVLNPMHWILGIETMTTSKPGSDRGPAAAKSFRSLSGSLNNQGEPCLKLVEMSPLRKSISKMQPKKQKAGKKMPKKGKKVSSCSHSRRRDVNGKQNVKKVPLYLRNLNDYNDPVMRNRIARAQSSKTFREKKDKKIDELTKENEKLKIEIKRVRKTKLDTDKKFKELAEESRNLKTELKFMKTKMEMIQTGMFAFVQNTRNILTANGMLFNS